MTGRYANPEFGSILKQISDERNKTSQLTEKEIDRMLLEISNALMEAAGKGCKSYHYLYDYFERDGDQKGVPIPREEIAEIISFFQAGGVSAEFVSNIICPRCKTEKCSKGLCSGYVFRWL